MQASTKRKVQTEEVVQGVNSVETGANKNKKAITTEGLILIINSGILLFLIYMYKVLIEGKGKEKAPISQSGLSGINTIVNGDNNTINISNGKQNSNKKKSKLIITIFLIGLSVYLISQFPESETQILQYTGFLMGCL